MFGFMPRKRQLFLLASFLAVCFFLFTFHTAPTPRATYQSFQSIPTLLGQLVPANRTLGFGAVIAVSRDGSPRRHGLLQAANVTEIDITIPAQPQWTDDDVAKLQGAEDSESRIGRGSVLAWLGHNNALKWFLDSGLETALILEDDVDWDIHLRSKQVPIVSQAVRTLLSHHPLTTAEENRTLATANPATLSDYWGAPSKWDLLYLGHCGDFFHPTGAGIGSPHHSPEDLKPVPHITFSDPTMPTNGDLHPWTASFLSALGVAEQRRIVHRSRFPLCTFGYAITREGARKLVEELAPARHLTLEQDGQKQAPAYDVAILRSCRMGWMHPDESRGEEYHFEPTAETVTAARQDFPGSTGRGLKCYTVNPELFHHMPGLSLIAQKEEKEGKTVGIPPVDAAGEETVTRTGETSNIGCGFWGGQFAFEEGTRIGEAKLRWLQEEVGRKGRCLKEGRS